MTGYTDVDSIQPGWAVWSSDGQELGTVIGTDRESIRIKKGGLFGGELTVPRSAVDEVETGRVDLSISKDEASAH